MTNKKKLKSIAGGSCKGWDCEECPLQHSAEYICGSVTERSESQLPKHVKDVAIRLLRYDKLEKILN